MAVAALAAARRTGGAGTQANPTLTAAQAALRQAQENVAAQRGHISRGRGRTVRQPQPDPDRCAVAGLGTGNPYYSLITPQLNVSFVPDVFGANRRTVKSLEAQAENQRFHLRPPI